MLEIFHGAAPASSAVGDSLIFGYIILNLRYACTKTVTVVPVNRWVIP